MTLTKEITRVGVYSRYSDDELQSPASVEDQIRECKEFAQREGWEVVAIYTDEGISGFTAKNRPGVQRLIKDAMSKKFDVVLSEALDRISRDQEDVAHVYKRMQFQGISMHTLTEGEITPLHIGMKGTMNALFLVDLSRKVKRGQRGRVLSGKIGGGNCYGYNVLKNQNANGEIERGEREINKLEADIIRRIFREYVDGVSPKAIAARLSREGIPSPREGTVRKGKIITGWSPTTIYGNWQRGSGILNNELYVGQLVWNKVSYPKNPDTGNHVARVNLHKDLVRTEIPELRIVDQDLWDSVKKRQLKARGEKKAFWAHQRPTHLFSYLLKCGCCGNGFSKISLAHYGCSTARNKGASLCKNLRVVRQDTLEETVLSILQTHLMEPKLLAEFCKEYTSHLNRLRMENNATVSSRKAELAKLQARQKRIVQAVMDGFSTEAMKEESNAIDRRERELKELISTDREAPVLLHPNMAQRYHQAVGELLSALRDKNHRTQAIELIRSLIEKIVLTPDENSEELLVNLYGDLAGILKLATVGKTAHSETELKQIALFMSEMNASPESMQDKMVAGEGLTLTRNRRNSRKHRLSNNSRLSPNPTGISVRQGKMVGPAGLEPATRVL